MKHQDEHLLSPTVTKVLDEYMIVLQADEKIDKHAIDRLDVLLRIGKVPKPEEIDAALNPPEEGEQP